MDPQPTTRDQLIEQAAQVIHAARFTPANDEPTAVDEVIARALADAGLLADPERRDEFIDWTLGRVRKALGTPDGRAVSIHAAEVRAELEKLAADHLTLLGQRDAWWEHVAKERREIEAERDALQARLDAALAFHVEYSIYADCGHADHDDDEDVVDLGDKYVCAEGYQYSVCLACCCDGDTGGQHEVCTDSHCPDERPNLCWPCPTRRALKDLAEPTGEVDRA